MALLDVDTTTLARRAAGLDGCDRWLDGSGRRQRGFSPPRRARRSQIPCFCERFSAVSAPCSQIPRVSERFSPTGGPCLQIPGFCEHGSIAARSRLQIRAIRKQMVAAAQSRSQIPRVCEQMSSVHVPRSQIPGIPEQEDDSPRPHSAPREKCRPCPVVKAAIGRIRPFGNTSLSWRLLLFTS